MNETISRSIFKFDEQKEKLQSDYYRLLQEESGLDEKKYIIFLFSLFSRFRKHREKVAKRKNEGDEQSEYHEQTHQTIKRRISDSELENSSISSSPTPSFEPMDLSGSKYFSLM